jgi:hypothetical protein
MLPLAVLWADPGHMTGIATLSIAGQQPGYQFRAHEYPFQDACSVIDSWCQGWGASLAIGWERFDINAQTHKKTREGIHDALHVIGVCRYVSAKYGCRVLVPAQQHTPDRADRERLQRLGWWVPGKDDAQSAACHMLRWLERENELTPEQREIVYGNNRP